MRYRLLKYSLLTLFIALVNICFSQQMPVSTQYLINPYNLSYSLAGYTGSSEVFIGYRNDWSKINGSPRTFRANGYGNVYQEKLWVGGEIISDKAGLLSVTNANVSATYKLQVENYQFLYFGIWTSFYQASVSTSDGIGFDPNDPLINNNSKINSSAFNAGFGLVYNWNKLNLGVSMPTAFGNSKEYESNGQFKYRVQRQFQVFGSYMFDMGKEWQLQSMIVYRKTVKQPATFELSAMSIYQGRFWGGLLFRNSGALGVNLGGLVFNGFVLNYSYEMGLSNMNKGSGGSHEITLGYRFNFSETNFFKSKKRNTGKGKSKKSKTSRPSSYPKVEDYNYKRLK